MVSIYCTGTSNIFDNNTIHTTGASATVLPGSTSVIRLGRTGIIMPMPTESRITVKIMILIGKLFLLVINF